MVALPRGFRIDQPQFWTNLALPGIVAVTLVLAIGLAWRQRFSLARSALAAMLVTYITLAISMRILYPHSYRLPTIAAGVMAFVMALATAQTLSQPAPRRWWSLGIAAIVGVSLGGVFPQLLRSADASTAPSSASLPPITYVAPIESPSRAAIRLRPDVNIHPGDGSANVLAGRAIITVHPLLTFISRSPDRFWTCFAARAAREGPPRRLLGFQRAADDDVELNFADDATSRLQGTIGDNGTLKLHAESLLPVDVFSHLNTFTEVHIAGHERLSISFSPCPAEVIALTPQDGAPARFAYVDADRQFHVVEASQSEKGPFRSLATGRLAKGAALTITLFDSGNPLATITLHDWASQASTAPSPTAGWGVPQNAIEFSLAGSSPRSTASFYITLAATSVGRGFDSVGHTAGTYVNRVDVQTEKPIPATR